MSRVQQPNAAPSGRMTAAQREQQLLRAAVTAFANGGYTGTTTDQVARIAGVSQPYVLRLFGTKQALFLAVHRHAAARAKDAFRTAAAALPADADLCTRFTAMGQAYLELSREPELLLVLQHGFMAAADPALGPDMRRAMTDMYRLVIDLTGADTEQTRSFIARGVLLNTMVALRMSEHLNEDPDAAKLVGLAQMSPAEQADHSPRG